MRIYKQSTDLLAIHQQNIKAQVNSDKTREQSSNSILGNFI